MENHDSRNAHPYAASTDERAPSLNPVLSEAEGPVPGGAEPPLLSDCLQGMFADGVADAVEQSFPPGARKPRHDGFTPEKVGEFLRLLAATGIVEHAAAAVGLSATAAYTFRNRRQGRAFARMWDAILIHRTRARVASELSGRAIAGCVSIRKRDGVVVGEYHYYDNRLAMSLLTRLDRLAEKEAASEAHLRALSEDMEEYIECVAAGGDADAFVEARRPPEPQPAPAAQSAPAGEPDPDPELTTFARLAGCPDYLDRDPRDIEVADLDLAEKAEWDPDQWVRAYRSGFMTWLHVAWKDDPAFEPGPGASLRFHFGREAASAAAAQGPTGADAEAERQEVDTSDLDPTAIDDWTEDQFARAWTSGFVGRLPDEFWEDLAARARAREEVE
jgi:hypothetical protein